MVHTRDSLAKAHTSIHGDTREGKRESVPPYYPAKHRDQGAGSTLHCREEGRLSTVRDHRTFEAEVEAVYLHVLHACRVYVHTQ